MLANSLTKSVLSLSLGKLFKQTLCISYITELIPGSWGYEQVIKIKHYVLSILHGLLSDHDIMNQGMKPGYVR